MSEEIKKGAELNPEELEKVSGGTEGFLEQKTCKGCGRTFWGTEHSQYCDACEYAREHGLSE